MTVQSTVVPARISSWRQGSVLGADSITALRDVHPEIIEGRVVVVISHDCDLAEQSLDREPYVELMVGKEVPQPDGGKRFGKALRFLHVDYSKDGSDVVVELFAAQKIVVPRGTWFKENEPDRSWVLKQAETKKLRNWLATRYDRSAFSNSFVEQLTQKKVPEAIEKLLKNAGYISHVFFDVDSGEELELESGQTHTLTVILSFVPGENPEETENKAEEIAEQIEKIFAEAFYNPKEKQWAGIHLHYCSALSEDEFKLSNARRLSEWRFEYLSYRYPEKHVTAAV